MLCEHFCLTERLLGGFALAALGCRPLSMLLPPPAMWGLNTHPEDKCQFGKPSVRSHQN